MPHELDLTHRTFTDEVLRAEIPVLVDFWAPWCGPCRAMMPVIDKLAQESGGRYRVGKVNVDHFPEIAQHYRISGVPTRLLFHRGRVVKVFEGVQSERTMRAAAMGSASRGRVANPEGPGKASALAANDPRQTGSTKSIRGSNGGL